MIVDDDNDVLTIFKKHLIHAGHHVHAFTDPVAAYEHFRSSSKEFALVLADIRMPVMNGFDLTRRIKALNPEVKVLLMSSFPITKSEVEKVLPSVKADGFIAKPVSAKDLGEIIQKHLVHA